MMKRRERQHDPVFEAAEWNRQVRVGETVEYRDVPDAAPELFTTRSEAFVLSGHTACVVLDRKAGCVALDACQPLKKSCTPVTR